MDTTPDNQTLFDRIFEFVSDKTQPRGTRPARVCAVPVQKVIERLGLTETNDEAFRARLRALGFTVRQYAHLLPDGTWEDWATSNYFCISI